MINLNKGVLIYIHNNTENASTSSEFIQISAGKETSIAIDRSILHKKPKPYSNCVRNADPLNSNPNKFISQTAQLFTTYSQDNCKNLCYQDFLARTYNCFDSYLPHITNSEVPMCGKLIDSVDNIVFYDRKLFMRQNESRKCSEYCRVACDSVAYTASVSSSEFPSSSYMDALVYNSKPIIARNNLSGSALRSSLASVNIFYLKNLQYAIVEEPATRFGIFIANLGGAIGLFIGASFLSFIEIFEFSFEVFMSTFNIINKHFRC